MRLDRDKISLGKLVQKKTVRLSRSRKVKTWNPHALHVAPLTIEISQAGNDSAFTVEITIQRGGSWPEGLYRKTQQNRF